MRMEYLQLRMKRFSFFGNSFLLPSFHVRFFLFLLFSLSQSISPFSHYEVRFSVVPSCFSQCQDERLGLGILALQILVLLSPILYVCDFPVDKMVMSSDNIHGLVLAISSSIFIGSSFIIKKKGLKKAGVTGTRAGLGGHCYLLEPWWWAGMISMIAGEAANFAAYAFAPAILVTPLGALSIIFSAVLAHFFLQEKLHVFAVLGCILCVVGSTTIVLHAPQEKTIASVKEVWHLATEPGFLIYTGVVIVAVSVLIFHFSPRYGQTHMIVYVAICSLTGSLTVMGVKAVGIAIKLSFSGSNQFGYFQTWLFFLFVVGACLLQVNYLNKALDSFNTAVISPVYYVLFTSFTIFASMIMFKDWDSQNASQIATELCGFITILSGAFLLHRTKDMGENFNGFSESPIFTATTSSPAVGSPANSNSASSIQRAL